MARHDWMLGARCSENIERRVYHDHLLPKKHYYTVYSSQQWQRRTRASTSISTQYAAKRARMGCTASGKEKHANADTGVPCGWRALQLRHRCSGTGGRLLREGGVCVRSQGDNSASPRNEWGKNGALAGIIYEACVTWYDARGLGRLSRSMPEPCNGRAAAGPGTCWSTLAIKAETYTIPDPKMNRHPLVGTSTYAQGVGGYRCIPGPKYPFTNVNVRHDSSS